MRWLLFRAPAPGRERRPSGRFSRSLLASASFTLLTLGGAAQMTQAPSRPPSPLIVPAANPMPDRNDQMAMRERMMGTRNFDLANAERLRQMMIASNMLETLAMALKAETDKPGPVAQDEIRKAADIERLARMVKERMKLTIGPN